MGGVEVAGGDVDRRRALVLPRRDVHLCGVALLVQALQYGGALLEERGGAGLQRERAPRARVPAVQQRARDAGGARRAELRVGTARRQRLQRLPVVRLRAGVVGRDLQRRGVLPADRRHRAGVQLARQLQRLRVFEF